MRRKQTDASEPVRSCIGCRERRPQSALVRITASARGITVDGASDGRGAWLCRSATDGRADTECLDAAIDKRAFARAWRRGVTDDEQRAIRDSAITNRADGHDNDNESGVPVA